MLARTFPCSSTISSERPRRTAGTASAEVAVVERIKVTVRMIRFISVRATASRWVFIVVLLGRLDGDGVWFLPLVAHGSARRPGATRHLLRGGLEGGAVWRNGKGRLACKLDLNHPPTSRWGDFRKGTSPLE